MSIIIVLSVLLTSFLTFSPNFAILVDRDFMSRAENTAYYAAHEFGQMAARAGILTDTAPNNVTSHTDPEPRLIFPLRWRGGHLHDSIRAIVTMSPTGNITVDLEHTYP